MENVLIIGGGGREHAIAWKLSQSSRIRNVFVAPGSFAIDQLPKTENVAINIKDFEEVAKWCKNNNVSLVAIGPEDPLANGIADILLSHNIHVFGPQKQAANIESDKDWAKAFMDRHAIPTARWKSFENASDAKEFINNADFKALVVKASGLAAGKGVIVASNKEEACDAVDYILTSKKFGAAGEIVVIEELLEGEEVSVLAFTDGKTIKAMLPAQDHKRIFDNDQGPNTGGMGAYCPCPFITPEMLENIQMQILQRTIDGLAKENIKYIGVLYAGLMLTAQGAKVLEFNCRFGDPETEVLMPMLETDLYEIMFACCTTQLDTINIKWKENLFAVGVVMASKGYPGTSSKGQVITGIDSVNNTNGNVVFHCGTAIKDDKIVTNGGRVLINVNSAPKLHIAAARATEACKLINFDGQQYRKDIAHKGIAKAILQYGQLSYKDSGVDISAGNDLVDYIKPTAKSTSRDGVVGGIGGFGGLFDTKLAGYKDPLLVSGTDGVGTKLKIAQSLNKHNTIGIDLVAMCVNDILAHGAEPLFFLDYFSCGKLEVDQARNVIQGIADGCKEAGCALIGGETAEMPDMYAPGEYDLAGFAVGAVERSDLMPHINQIEIGDFVIGLPSSGLHSNGFSLVRKVIDLAGVSYNDKAPFSSTNSTFGEEFLIPTRIYVKALMSVIKSRKVCAFAHITGGGLTENIPRVLPKHLSVNIDASKWKIPNMFAWLAAIGGINEAEMLRTFNCGIGGVLIVKKSLKVEVMKLLEGSGASIIGEVTENSKDGSQVTVQNFSNIMEPLMRPYIKNLMQIHVATNKRVAVLISGSGSNLQALIDATSDQTKRMGCDIVLVISNKPDVLGLKRAETVGIPTKVINHKDYKTRDDFDMALHVELIKHNIDIICLAGFMRILTADFTKKWRGRLINIHPALLPSFKGIHAAKQALEYGVRVAGCTVHFVEADVDAGAILVQEIVPVQIGDTEDSLLDRIHPAEHVAYPKALKLLATGKAVLGDDNNIVWK